MKNLKIVAASLLIISIVQAQAGEPLPPRPFKTPLQREMDLRGFSPNKPSDTLINLVNTYSKKCTADINSAGNVVVVKMPSGEIVIRLSLLSKISITDWNTVYDAC